MTGNPLRELQQLGQSVWLDDIRRAWLRDGTLARLIADDGVSGVTSNPAIFEKTITQGGEYDAAIARLARAGASCADIYETLALDDVRSAADLLRPAFEATGGRDGFVSLEVSPHLADDTDATVREGLRLWAAFGRPNAMIKVPATASGLAAIRALLAGGVNVNVTLVFGVARYRDVVESFLAGLEQRAGAGEPLGSVASVASFFVSRIDTLVDQVLDAAASDDAAALRGRVATASARLAYDHFRAWTQAERWQRLAACGAMPQRLLWASTSVKDDAYPDVKYVEALAGPQTVNTMPRETLDAYRRRGRPAPRLAQDVEAARATLQALARLGVDLDAVSLRLEREGVGKFIEPYDRLLASLRRRAAALAA